VAPTVAFDVIGSLFSLERLREPIRRLGAPDAALEVWFAQSLRDFFAWSHAGGYVPLAEVLDAALPRTLAALGVDTDAPGRATVIDTLAELEPAPGAAEACAVLTEAGCRLVALTNGSRDFASGLLERAGLDRHFAAIHSCDDVRTSKPAPVVYGMVDRAAGEDTWMVAAHAWDVAGAQRAGLRGAWVAGSERMFSAAFPPPDVTGEDLADVARRLLAV
jgi:2-haloacid dehalogenase